MSAAASDLIAPVLLVGYITTMFSADIRYGLGRAKLLSETDDLTGLLNVRGFERSANRLFAPAARHGSPGRPSALRRAPSAPGHR